MGRSNLGSPELNGIYKKATLGSLVVLERPTSHAQGLTFPKEQGDNGERRIDKEFLTHNTEHLERVIGIRRRRGRMIQVEI